MKPSFTLRALSFLLCLLFSFHVAVVAQQTPTSPAGITYYVDPSGSDNNNGTSPSTPWKTLTRANAAFTSLRAGDAILLKRGEVFTGTLSVTRSGTAALPIVVGAYGSGGRPVISGFSTLANWASVGNNIWESDFYAGAFGGEYPGYGGGGYYLSTVVVNGRLQGMGRWPNATDANKGYRNITTGGRSSLYDASLTGAINWTGAELVHKPVAWSLDRCPITSHSNGTINFVSPDQYGASANFGYFIQNSAATLDQQNEWYYNPATRKLRLYSGVNPSALVVKASLLDELVVSRNQSDVTFDNISFEGSDVYTMNLLNTNRMKVINCNFTWSGRGFINLDGAQNSVISYSDFYQAGSSGIYGKPYWGSLAPKNTLVSHCNIRNIGMIAGLGWNNDDQHMGVFCHDTEIVEYCTVDSIGGTGIKFHGDNSIIRYNNISNFNMTIQDAGGIYSHGDQTTMQNREVHNNVISNGIGAPEGTDLGRGGDGIYMDDATNGVNIHDNTISNCAHTGIYLHNTTNITVRNNTVFNNGEIGLFLHHQENVNVDMVNLNIKGNVIFDTHRTRLKAEGNPFQYTTPNSALRGLAFDYNSWNWSMDSNCFARPFVPYGVMEAGSEGYNKRFFYDAPSWSALHPSWERHGIESPQLKTFNVSGTIGANRFANGSFNSSVYGVSVYNGTASFSAGQLDGGCVRVSPQVGSGARQVNFNMGAVSAGQVYRIRFSLLGTAHSEGNLQGFIGNYTPWAFFPLREGRTECEWFYEATSNMPSVDFSLLMYSPDQTFYVDNINIQQVTGTPVNMADSVRFEYNTSNVNKVISLNGTYKDVRNVSYDNQITLAPFTSAILIKTGGAPIAANKAPHAHAGADITVTLPVASVVLNGTSSIDADGTISAFSWNRISGPSYMIENRVSGWTYITGVTAGTYMFELAVTDNKGAVGLDTMMITVLDVSNKAPHAHAGADVTVTLPVASVVLNGTSSIDADGSITTFSWNRISGPSYTIENNVSGWTYITGVTAGTYVFELAVTDNKGAVGMDTMMITVLPKPNQAPSANAGADMTITLPVNTVTLNAGGSADADGSIEGYSWKLSSGPSGSVITNASGVSTAAGSLTEGVYAFQVTVTDNDGAVSSDIMNVNVLPAPNKAPHAHAGADITVTLPVPSVILNGTSSIDADGTIRTFSWNRISGPSYTIENSVSGWTYITGVTAGTYVFELAVTDNKGAVGTDTLVITVLDIANKAPHAHAGADITVTLPVASVVLNGTSSIDADGTIRTFSWNRISGPSYTIENSVSGWTYITGVTAGTYVFQLAVTDNKGAVGMDTLVINVLDIPNKAPHAHAGADITVTLPVSSVVLNGTSSLDPDGTIRSFSWSRISGPAYTIENSVSGWTYITGVTAGTYVFELSVTDNKGAVGMDTVKIVVQAAAIKAPQAKVAVNAGLKITMQDAASASRKVEPVTAVQDLTVFPNPAVDMITVNYGNARSGKVQMNIIDASGRIIRTAGYEKGSASLEAKVNISNLKAGMYYLQLTTDAGVQVIKQFMKN